MLHILFATFDQIRYNSHHGIDHCPLRLLGRTSGIHCPPHYMGVGVERLCPLARRHPPPEGLVYRHPPDQYPRPPRNHLSLPRRSEIQGGICRREITRYLWYTG